MTITIDHGHIIGVVFRSGKMFRPLLVSGVKVDG